MQQIIDIPRHLKLRFLPNQPIDSNSLTSGAVFQFVVQGTEEFLIQVNDACCIQFTVFYKYQNKICEHPFTLFTNANNNPVFQFHAKGLYNIPLFLKLKRLRDFNETDWKNYYQTIDENLGVSVNFSDFHDIYLKIFYYHHSHRQWIEYICNDSLPIHLPKFISNQWTHTNTLFRFRYDAENRDGVFPCQMQLLHHDVADINSYKIVLCLATNTIPARMDFHSLRRTSKRSTKRGEKSTTAGDEVQPYQWHHLGGIIVAEISGSDLTFSSPIQLDHSKSGLDDVKDDGGLTIGVIKEKDYPKIVEMRRRDKTIFRYIPFNEINDMDMNFEGGDKEIIKHLKLYKRECYKQLILDDQNDKKTYNQAHVRLYVAAYDENNILLAETLHPPLRDTKTFEQLQIIKIIQSKLELHSGDKAFIYCIYDSDKSKAECPYIIEFAFSTNNDKLDDDQLQDMFEKQRVHTQTSYIDKCPNLLEFSVPNEPMYHKQRVFIRLQHKSSLDYNPSPPALNDNECWIYYTEANFIIDDSVAVIINETDNDQNHNEYDRNLNTPYFELETL